MEDKENGKKKWYLYVLRYNYSGNYYVGDTEDLKKRMLIHLRRTSKLPKASWANHSTKGFKYYWFAIDSYHISRSETECSENDSTQDSDNVLRRIADLSENAFTREIGKMTEKLKDNIRGGDTAKDPYIKINPVAKEALEDDDEHKKIHLYLKNIKKHKLETKKEHGEYSIISLLQVGAVGEFQNKDCCKKWCEVASVEFSNDNKEK